MCDTLLLWNIWVFSKLIYNLKNNVPNKLYKQKLDFFVYSHHFFYLKKEKNRIQIVQNIAQLSFKRKFN
jgi:hypothetical protein